MYDIKKTLSKLYDKLNGNVLSKSGINSILLPLKYLRNKIGKDKWFPFKRQRVAAMTFVNMSTGSSFSFHA